MNTAPMIQFLGMLVVVSPVVLFFVFGLFALMGRHLKETVIARCTEITVLTGLCAAILVLAYMLVSGVRYFPVEFGNWVSVEDHISASHFHFHLKFVFDRLSIPFVILTYLLVGLTGAFANRYLHRESGYRRFFLLYAMFLLGMVVATLAGTIETLFLGWELVGLSSALLVAYFHERQTPVDNGLRVWSVYRVADAAFLAAAIALHHFHGAGDFALLMGTGPWPYGQAGLTANQALLVGILLLIAAAGKSALVPFSGWLPRAMEGPTPSSAIFYGALSVHLGCFLLLRVSPLLEISLALKLAVIILGLISAIFGSMAASVQTDVKSAIAFSSLSQVGIITVEIGLGLQYLALVHIIGHACLRTLQLLRAPTLIHDYHDLENAIGQHLDNDLHRQQKWMPASWRMPLYRLAYEKGFLDAWLDRLIVNPFRKVFQQCDAWERAWTNFLAGKPSRESDQVPVHEESSEGYQA